jgi:4-diphosphocytidyl-2-C-methyl-D-erythritol kinase
MASRSNGAVRVRALAKINLSLRVLGTHADGYHELRTTFQSLALHDTLTLTPTRGPLTLTADDPGCPSDRTNLVWQAAERLWRDDRRRGRPSGVTMHLDKRIPMQAGLGGGSSDAAAALRGLARVWKMRVSDGDLHRLAAGLGADVAYFLRGGSALGVGRGEVLFPLEDRPSAIVVLVIPDFGVSTKDAYRWWDESHDPAVVSSQSGWTVAGGEQGNDLERPVAARHPEVSKIVKRLRALGAAEAAMSGSGSAVFGLFPNESAAFLAADALASRSRRVTITRTVGRREYQRLSAPA